MKKNFLFFVGFLLIVFSANLLAQPQYYNYQNVGSSSNSFPFGQTAGKEVQWLLLAGDLNMPTPLPAGNMITKVYFYVTLAGTRTFNDLTIKMGPTNITTLPTGDWYTGQLDTVYHGTSVMLTGTANTWMSITLDTPYPYDPAMGLVIEVNQCGSSGSGISIRQNGLSGFRRSWSGTTTGCPFLWGGQDANIANFGVDVVPAPSVYPDVLYYKFENNPGALLTPNCAIPGAGTDPAPIVGHTITSGGQFDSCLSGTGGTNSRINTGWNCDLGSGNWTISFWVNNLTDLNPTYLFGDPGSTSFRCFYGGAAGVDNLLLRGPMTDILIPCPAGPQVFHFVYDGTNVIIYRNGTLVSTNPRAINMPTGSGFFVGGYNGTGLSGKMDEFRLIKYAYSPAEVATTWNSDLGGCGITSTGNNNNEAPLTYKLLQNYPNPFNPVTSINFTIPRSELVELRVYDMLGREVSTLINKQMNSGTYSVNFDASNLSSGVYFYTLKSGDFTETKKMMLVK